jgi:DNA-binding XRE family transcriptional regulator
MFVITTIMETALTAQDLGLLIRGERKARGYTQSWVAQRVGCRRQTIADLEAGRNVALHIVMRTLATLGKGLSVVDARVDLERLSQIFPDDDDDGVGDENQN